MLKELDDIARPTYTPRPDELWLGGRSMVAPDRGSWTFCGVHLLGLQPSACSSHQESSPLTLGDVNVDGLCGTGSHVPAGGTFPTKATVASNVLIRSGILLRKSQEQRYRTLTSSAVSKQLLYLLNTAAASCGRG